MLGFVDRLGERLTGFLGVMLSGLARSDQRATLDTRMAEWLTQEKHLVEMAHYMQFAPEFDGELLRKILIAGIKRDDEAIVVQVMASYARRFADAEEGTITTIFMEAIRFFTSRKDARWVNLVWFIPKERSPLRTLDAGQVDPILESLVHLPSIETHGEWVLASLAEKYPEKVFDFFGARMRYREAGKEGERYEDIPHEFECLQRSFAPIAEYAVATARKWFLSGDSMFQFRGGRLLAIGFPDFAEPFRHSLFALAQTGQRADVEFVLRVLTSYHGQTFLNELCKAIVNSLPDDDPFLTDIEIILESTENRAEQSAPGGVRVSIELRFVQIAGASSRIPRELEGEPTDDDDRRSHASRSGYTDHAYRSKSGGRVAILPDRRPTAGTARLPKAHRVRDRHLVPQHGDRHSFEIGPF